MTRHAAPPPDDQRVRLRAAFRHSDLSAEQLWTRYFGLGGDADLLDVEAHLEGLQELPTLQADLLALAVNERLDELTAERRVPFVQLLQDARPPGSPLRSLAELLEAAHRSPPERLGAIAREAGRTLGVDVTVHLADHEQQHLVPLPSGVPSRSTRLRIDGTLPGRSYQNLEILPSVAGGTPRLWVPLEDGTERLGVLEVRLATAEAFHDAGLRDHCRWLALLIGHLVASIGRYGDELERVRRSRPPTPAAELIWRQLPPLTAATDDFVLAGSLEPTYDVGGDAFDFALTEHTVSLAVFDAMGHGMPAAILASAALAAYRSTRRDRRGIYEQARSIDETIARCFPGSAFVTGVLAELDVASGRLRYVAAGHPPPLVLRGRKVVKSLDGGRRVPFGLGDGGFAVAEEVLQPGDWLALYTDGITEARDASGAWFGEERLVELLARASAAGHPPPETVRRLTRAVLEHQGGLLQDDATVLLASWRAPAPPPGV
ncbi:PP2C family protein-serine/threonine phosphatase [Blastococcus sp. TF02A-30]|uniref:PP2C family protein-serine/threonine phosphatase n=1 Tax=Blastococcus sp. TF02A-30 TaxID=2250580 RepID=UPI000DEA6B42|nr:PP2C family protein-serine/threonine phosphatase [Blastococcus sp. TF02A-30]RBY85766.1 serine/threonine-protein phosphatase [Blastococcus sp. TF02A-30]